MITSPGRKVKKEVPVIFGLITPPGTMWMYGWKTFTREGLRPIPHLYVLMCGPPETGQNGMHKQSGDPITGARTAIATIQGHLQLRCRSLYDCSIRPIPFQT